MNSIGDLLFDIDVFFLARPHRITHLLPHQDLAKSETALSF
jgi:hypothetical protein